MPNPKEKLNNELSEAKKRIFQLQTHVAESKKENAILKTENEEFKSPKLKARPVKKRRSSSWG